MNNTQVAKVDDNSLSDLKLALSNTLVLSKFEKILGKKAQSFVQTIISVASQSLKNVDSNSIIASALIAATLDLPIQPSLGFACIVPFYDSKTKTTKAQFLIQVKGFYQLAMRSGLIKSFIMQEVKDSELLSYNRFTDEFVWSDNVGKIDIINEAPTVGYYAKLTLTNGFEKALYLSKKEAIDYGKKYSKSFDKGLWSSDIDVMGLKTVVKKLLRSYAPLSTEMQTALIVDESEISNTGEVLSYPTSTIAQIPVEIGKTATPIEITAKEKEVATPNAATDEIGF